MVCTGEIEVGASVCVTLAGMYAPLANGGSLKGVNLVNRDILARMASVSSASGLDTTLLLPTRFSLGYAKSADNRREPSFALWVITRIKFNPRGTIFI